VNTSTVAATRATTNHVTTETLSNCNNNINNSNSNVVTEQQRRILKRPSNSPSRRKRSDLTTTTSVNVNISELPTTSKECKQIKRDIIEIEIVPNVTANVTVVENAVTTLNATNNQQPLINSTCVKTNEATDAETFTTAATTTTSAITTNVMPAAATATMPEDVNNFAGYLQDVELVEGVLINSTLIYIYYIN